MHVHHYATLFPYSPRMHDDTRLGYCDADTELARVHELEIDTQFLPLSIYTLGVDYTDVSVQVGNRAPARKRPSHATNANTPTIRQNRLTCAQADAECFLSGD